MTNIEKYFDLAVYLYDNGDNSRYGAEFSKLYNSLTDDEKKEIECINNTAKRYIASLERAKIWGYDDEVETLERKFDKFPNVVKQAIYLIDET